MWTDNPSNLTASHVQSIPLAPAALTIIVYEGNGTGTGPTVAGATVCLQKGSETYAVGTTDTTGTVILHVTPKTVGNIDLTVWKHNYLPLTDEIPVTQAPGPMLCYADHSIIDSGGSGNGNKVVDAGETISMPVEIRNTGSQDALGVVATLSATTSASPPWVTITVAQQSYPNITAGGAQWSNGNFVFSVRPDTPDGTVVTFQLDIEALGGVVENYWTDTFTETVHAPVLSQAIHYVWDSDGDGILGPNETALIPVTIRNDGSGQADAVTATLTASSPYIIVNNPNESFGTILPRSEVGNSTTSYFAVQTLPMYQQGDRVTMIIADNRSHSVNVVFDFVPQQVPTGLQVIPGQMCMDLQWAPTPGALGYHVYRMLPTELNYTRVDDDLLTTGSLFHDSNVPADSLCQYRVTVVNSTGNESVAALTGSNKSNPPMASNWPREVGSNGINGSCAIGDLNGDGQNEIVVCSGDNKIYVWEPDGTLAPGWPKEVPMPDSGTPTGLNTSPALADLNGNGKQEIVVSAGFYVYVWNGEGDLLPGWPQQMAGPACAGPAIGDIDGDGKYEIIAPSSAAKVYAWHADGTLVAGWPVSIDDPSDWVRTNVALADVNADGAEIIGVTLDTQYVQSQVYVWKGDGTRLPGWPQNIDFVAWASPVVGDLDHDGRLEIVVANLSSGSGGKIYCWYGDGSVHPGNWPYQISGGVPNGLALADINGDGKLEIIAPVNDGHVLALKSDGTAVSGWPVTAPVGMSDVAVADIEGDNSNEIIASCGGELGSVDVFRSDGSVLAGSPYVTTDGVVCAVTVADVFNTGFTDLVVGNVGRQVYMWSLSSPFNPVTSPAPWPTFMHDYRRTGCPEVPYGPVPFANIATVKLYGDGAWVKVSSKIVTTGTDDFAGKIYVEESDRSSGIEVQLGAAAGISVSRYQTVDIVGNLATVNGERVLTNPTISPAGPLASIGPLGMNNTALGGGPLGTFTSGVTQGVGPNNLGLLVRSWGRVTDVATDGSCFYIQDGSNTGPAVCVSLQGLASGNSISPPHKGDYVAVTGISSCEIGAPQPVRTLRPRSQGDITVQQAVD